MEGSRYLLRHPGRPVIAVHPADRHPLLVMPCASEQSFCLCVCECRKPVCPIFLVRPILCVVQRVRQRGPTPSPLPRISEALVVLKLRKLNQCPLDVLFRRICASIRKQLDSSSKLGNDRYNAHRCSAAWSTVSSEHKAFFPALTMFPRMLLLFPRIPKRVCMSFQNLKGLPCEPHSPIFQPRIPLPRSDSFAVPSTCA